MKQIDQLKQKLQPGEVYRRADLEQWSAAVDRHLQQLVREGVLEKLSGGLYFVPRQSTFGKAPADERELLSSFLKGDRFVVTSPGDYNALGLGTTQLYNERRVYNRKRHGMVKLGNRTFRFVRKPFVPEKLSAEFLLVDLVNNLGKLEEDQAEVMQKVRQKARELNREKLTQLVQEFGTVGTKKKFADLLN